MRPLIVLLAAWLCFPAAVPVAAHEGPSPAAACDAIRRDQPSPAVNPATPHAVATPADTLAPGDVTAAIATLPPLDQPVQVRREANAGQGTVTLSLPEPLGGPKAEIAASSGAAGPIGNVVRDGDYLVFEANHLSYDLAPFELPGGIEVGSQKLDLDPAHADILCIDTATGAVFRHFRWILTPTNATYDGQPTLALEDTAHVDVLGFTERDNGEAELHLRTRWKSPISLDTWTVDGKHLPGGTVDASSTFEDTYLVNLGG